MKLKLFLLTLFLSLKLTAQIPCSGGFASGFPCNEIDLYSNLTITQLGGTATAEGNDIWGWTDSMDGKEYAIIGLTSHTSFVDITDPTSPIYLGRRNGHLRHFLYGDISNYQYYNRALSASEVQQNFNALRGRFGI